MATDTYVIKHRWRAAKQILQRVDRDVMEELGVERLADAKCSDEVLGDKIIQGIEAVAPSLAPPVLEQVLMSSGMLDAFEGDDLDVQLDKLVPNRQTWWAKHGAAGSRATAAPRQVGSKTTETKNGRTERKAREDLKRGIEQRAAARRQKTAADEKAAKAKAAKTVKEMRDRFKKETNAA